MTKLYLGKGVPGGRVVVGEGETPTDVVSMVSTVDLASTAEEEEMRELALLSLHDYLTERHPVKFNTWSLEIELPAAGPFRR